MVKGRKSVKQKNRSSKKAATDNMDSCPVQYRKRNEQGYSYYAEQHAYKMGDAIGKFFFQCLFSLHQVTKVIDWSILYVYFSQSNRGCGNLNLVQELYYIDPSDYMRFGTTPKLRCTQ